MHDVLREESLEVLSKDRDSGKTMEMPAEMEGGGSGEMIIDVSGFLF